MSQTDPFFVGFARSGCCLGLLANDTHVGVRTAAAASRDPATVLPRSGGKSQGKSV